MVCALHTMIVMIVMTSAPRVCSATLTKGHSRGGLRNSSVLCHSSEAKRLRPGCGQVGSS